MIILDLKRFKVWIEPGPIHILGQAHQSHCARPIKIDGLDTIIILYAIRFKVWIRPGPIPMMGLAKSLYWT